MSAATISVQRSDGWRGAARLSNIPGLPDLTDSDARLVANVAELLASAVDPGFGPESEAFIRRSVEGIAGRSASPIRVEFESGWPEGDRA